MKELIKDVIIALIIVGAITIVIKPTIVKESSMEPTLYENNYLNCYCFDRSNKEARLASVEKALKS